MFRNPTAHEPKVDWEISEQNALEILGIISYCHRRLDNYPKQMILCYIPMNEHTLFGNFENKGYIRRAIETIRVHIGRG